MAFPAPDGYRPPQAGGVDEVDIDLDELLEEDLTSEVSRPAPFIWGMTFWVETVEPGADGRKRRAVLGEAVVSGKVFHWAVERVARWRAK